MKKAGLYVHIPFCKQKCHYCDFISYAGIENQISTYIEALKGEMAQNRHYQSAYEVDTIYFGGGTPSLLSGEQVQDLLTHARTCFNISEDAEISMEANPGTLTKENLERYKRAGVNRLSIGLQAAQDELLQRLGRLHTCDDFVRSFRLARDCGFNNINVDIMFGLPNQTLSQLQETFQVALRGNAEHISCYGLKVEAGTLFNKQKQKGQLSLPDEDVESEMLDWVEQKMRKLGYMHYEISNFAKLGYECRHHLHYWRNESYFGLGCAAHGYIEGKRMANTTSVSQYIEKIRQNESPVVHMEKEDEKNRLFTEVMLKLRLSEGLDLNKMADIHGDDMKNKILHAVETSIRYGYASYTNGRLALNEKGFRIQNAILLPILQKIT